MTIRFIHMMQKFANKRCRPDLVGQTCVLSCGCRSIKTRTVRPIHRKDAAADGVTSWVSPPRWNELHTHLGWRHCWILPADTSGRGSVRGWQANKFVESCMSICFLKQSGNPVLQLASVDGASLFEQSEHREFSSVWHSCCLNQARWRGRCAYNSLPSRGLWPCIFWHWWGCHWRALHHPWRCEPYQMWHKGLWCPGSTAATAKGVNKSPHLVNRSCSNLLLSQKELWRHLITLNFLTGF